jgi:signal-transduction protein with cAMP-binding, CBS, and nucleotidyltransferase domain
VESLQPRIWHSGYVPLASLKVNSLILLEQVTAEGLDPRTTLVSQIMTKNPMVTRDTTSATQALQLMVEKHFRHLVSTFDSRPEHQLTRHFP